MAIATTPSFGPGHQLSIEGAKAAKFSSRAKKSDPKQCSLEVSATPRSQTSSPGSSGMNKGVLPDELPR
jgi:hypothetical protein